MHNLETLPAMLHGSSCRRSRRCVRPCQCSMAGSFGDNMQALSIGENFQKLRDHPPDGYGFIYKITAPNGKAYIGQTRQTIARRLYLHMWCKTACKAIAAAFDKYGVDQMSVLILGVFQISDLTAQEDAFIKEHGTMTPGGYNLRTSEMLSEPSRERITAGLTGRKLSAAHRAKMSEIGRNKVFSESHRRAISAALTGRILTQAQKEKMSAAKLGRKYTEEHIRNMTIARNKRGSVRESTREKMRIAQLRRWQTIGRRAREGATQ